MEHKSSMMWLCPSQSVLVSESYGAWVILCPIQQKSGPPFSAAYCFAVNLTAVFYNIQRQSVPQRSSVLPYQRTFLLFLLNLLLDGLPAVPSALLLNRKPSCLCVSAACDYRAICPVSWREHGFVDFKYTERLERLPQVSSASLIPPSDILSKVRSLPLNALQDGADHLFSWWCRYEVPHSLLVIPIAHLLCISGYFSFFL